MVVTVIAVMVVQMRCDGVIRVIAVWNPFVAATRAVTMSGFVLRASVRIVASAWLTGRHR